MLNWIFKKRSTLELRPVPAATAPAPAVDAQGEAQKAIERARRAEAAQAEWAPRLDAARGDEAALLRLAQDCPVLDLKIAAVQALTTEALLKQAEKAFRDHDRRVHRLAKQRLEAAVARRESRERAQTLIDAAQALGAEMPIPVNRLVSLDRDWAALAADLLTPEQRQQFEQARGHLDALMREHDERVAAQARQAAEAAAAAQAQALAEQEARQAEQALRDEQAAAERARLQEDQARDAQARAQAQAEEAAAAAARKAAQKASAEQLAPLQQALTAAEAALADGELAAMEARLDEADAAAQALKGLQWPDKLRHRLQALHAERARLNGWRRWGGARAREDLVAEAEALARLVPGTPQAVASAEETPASPQAASSPEATVAEAPAEVPADVPAAVPLPAESAADPVADQAAAEVPALAPAEPATEPAAEAPTPATDGPVRHARAPKLNLKTHADAIQQLRNRWKQLDKVGAAAAGSLWQRFDAALRHAYQPVAAQQAAQKAARQHNLAQRLALLDALDQVPLPDADLQGEALAAAWKAVIHALDHHQLAWRQLGPQTHTVPAAELPALQQRQQACQARLEEPLAAARRHAQAQRERLIEQAQALVPAEEGQAPSFDAPRRVRELQAQWQQQAKSLTLARATERALWDRFRAATQAVFDRKEAAARSRDAEFAANFGAREALIAQLQALPTDGPEGELRRALADLDQQWRQGPEVLRAQAPKLEERWQAARAVAQQALASSGQRRWLAHCQALAARLALCREREAGAADADTLNTRWTETGDTAPAWFKPLAARWQQPASAPGPLADEAVDAMLLQLEASLDLPATPEQQAARRQHKLLAMKQALEGRGGAAAPQAPREAFAALLRQPRLPEAQARRLDALVTALPAATPGAFV